ncbi:hypothetical protein [uncultured Amaricoccus sp.]|uniref:hypothetical protein n=1 Tax=uncultured Amaricoccus sp. TaxID=339341 RepID=UPI00262A43F3|nr:hypothetical protein [uncultured Amaricoccus sp.]
MQIAVDHDDYVSILAHAQMLGRRLAPVLEADLPALLGRRTPSGLRRVADAARAGRLHAGFPRHMLPVIVDACAMAIEDGTEIAGEWIEVGYSDGGVDWAWRETTVYTDEARHLIRLWAMVSEVIDLLDRIDELVTAQRDVGEIVN